MARITRIFVKPDRFSTGTSSVAYSDDGGATWRWQSNDSVIMLDVCRDYGIPCDEVAQSVARDAYVTERLDEYRRTQPPVPSAEQQAEMRAAFGPGKDIVDVVTGRRFRT